MAEVSFTSAESYKGSIEQLVGLVRVERSCEEALRVDVHTISGSFRVLVEESTWKKLGPEYFTNCIGEYYLKGRRKKSKIYRIFPEKR